MEKPPPTLNPKSRKGKVNMAMYCINKRVQDGWEQEYPQFECDADAMQYGRNQLSDTCIMVSVYRHDDHDTCGRKKFIAAYDR